jgi:hypothetical protein
MPIEVADLSDEQLDNVIENHRRKGATGDPLCRAALEERERRKGFDFNKSVAIIIESAKKEKFLSYKELADASGLDWARARYALGNHLWNLIEYSYYHCNKILFSSIVVNQPNKETGHMEPETLKGFVGAARLLGVPVVNEQRFLEEQQKKVFEWAKSQIKPKMNFDP